MGEGGLCVRWGAYRGFRVADGNLDVQADSSHNFGRLQRTVLGQLDKDFAVIEKAFRFSFRQFVCVKSTPVELTLSPLKSLYCWASPLPRTGLKM